MKLISHSMEVPRELEAKVLPMLAERVSPLLTMTAVLPMAGISIASPEAAVISVCTTLVNFALQRSVLDRVKESLFGKRAAMAEYCVVAAVNHSIAALAVFKVFELVAR